MTFARYVGRVLIVAAVCALTTTWLGWITLPVVGFVYGLIDHRTRGRGSIAALGAMLAWLGILGAEAARGASVWMVATRLGEVMQIPAAAFAALTLVFAAFLSGPAATLGALIRGGRTATGR